jgi:RNA polymerase-binding transcription factor DksA
MAAVQERTKRELPPYERVEALLAAEADRLGRLLQALEADLAATHAARARLEGGSYGTCERCGGAISAERLDAIPECRFCRDCASTSSVPVASFSGRLHGPRSSGRNQAADVVTRRPSSERSGSG